MNLGVEGMMAMGAIGGYLMTCYSNSIAIGLLSAFLSAALGGLIYAFLTVSLQENQNLSGLALTIFGVSVYQFIANTLYEQKKFSSLNEHIYI